MEEVKEHLTPEELLVAYKYCKGYLGTSCEGCPNAVPGTLNQYGLCECRFNKDIEVINFLESVITNNRMNEVKGNGIDEKTVSVESMKTLKERDAELEILWGVFGDIPMDCETECIEEPFLSFPAGTNREEIWHWFDERHSKGISYLLYGYPFWEKKEEYKDNLSEFVKEEIPFRIVSVLKLDVPKEIIEGCTEWFLDHSDIMLDFETIDNKIREYIQKNEPEAGK